MAVLHPALRYTRGCLGWPMQGFRWVRSTAILALAKGEVLKDRATIAASHLPHAEIGNPDVAGRRLNTRGRASVPMESKPASKPVAFAEWSGRGFPDNGFRGVSLGRRSAQQDAGRGLSPGEGR